MTLYRNVDNNRIRAIMAAAIALVNLLIMIIFQPWSVNPPGEDLGLNNIYVLDPSHLEFIDYEDESIFPWKDTMWFVGVCGLIGIASYLLVLMQQQNAEIETVLNKCFKSHEKVMEIETFYRDTEAAFNDLQSKSKAIHNRFRNVETKIKNTKDYDQVKEDLDYLEQGWNEQCRAFSVLDINLAECVRPISDISFKAQLTMINGIWGKELRTIESHMTEDLLSLDEVSRDVKSLQNYFGK